MGEIPCQNVWFLCWSKIQYSYHHRVKVNIRPFEQMEEIISLRK
jgi:hypothetical protein